MLKTLTTALASLVISTAAADAQTWRYDVDTSEFDGSKTESIVGVSKDGAARLTFFAGRGGTINNPAVRVVWTPGVQFICNESINDTQYVSLIFIGYRGEIVARENLMDFQVSSSRQHLSVADRYLRKDGKWDSWIVTQAMYLLSTEVRLQARDSCGEKLFSAFDLTGFRAVVDQLNTQNN